MESDAGPVSEVQFSGGSKLGLFLRKQQRMAALNLAFEVAEAEPLPSSTSLDPLPELTLDRRQNDKLLEPLINRLDKVLARDGLLF